MASTSAATTTKQQANTDLMDATKSDDEAQFIAPTSVLSTKQQPILDLVEATKSDEEAKAATATSEDKQTTRRILSSLTQRNRMAKRRPLLQRR
jgi:hypothetical protein